MSGPDDDRLRAGEALGGYVVEAELAVGGMGIVYRAREEALDRTVALKVIAAAHARDRTFRERFRAECQMAARIEHPSAVAIYRSGQDRGRLFLAMRFIEGTDLATLLRTDGPLAPERAVKLIGDVAGALDAAHAAGLVHRDVKPANVLLDSERAYLTDFGVAFAAANDVRLTRTGQWVGTLAYAAPEQLRGAAVDARTDVYALGGVLHYCLTGEPPFPVAHELDAVSAHLMDPPPRPSVVDPRLPRAYDDVVARAMSKDPAHRFPSAGALAAAARTVPERRTAPAPRRTEAIPWLSRSGLPEQPMPLVGRGRELVEVRQLLASRRLVTLTGPGGAGKTRLALQAATEAADEYTDGVSFVGLAAILDPAHVSGAIARAVGVQEDELAGQLSGRRTLIVLDNAEHVVSGVADAVTALLDAAPDLRMLVTSRTRLDLREEQEYPVEPLAVADAVELFTQAARRARPAFVPDGDVERLVRRLDGLPLAVELAAARVRVLTPAQIAERLGAGLDLLTTRARDVPVRQRTLRATIEWSYALLDPAERELLARTSVFAGTFDLEAALAVCGADLDTVGGLVDHSLLRETGDGRLFLLDTIRAFAAEQLASDPELDAETRRRHLRHFAALVRGGPPGGGALEPWLTRTRRDLGHYHVALETAARTEPETLARLVADLGEAWPMLGPFGELAGWVERALERPPADKETRLRLLNIAALAAHLDERHAEAASHFRVVVALAQELGDRRSELLALARLGSELSLLDDPDGAEQVLQRALAGADETGDAAARAKATANLAAVALIRSDFAAARRLAEDTAAAYRELDAEDRVGQALSNAGFAAVRDGRLEIARAHLVEALAIFLRLGWVEGTVYALIGGGALAAQAGDARSAALLLGRAEAVRAEIGLAVQRFEREMADEALEAARVALGVSQAERAFAEGADLGDAEAQALLERASGGRHAGSTISTA